MYFCSFVFFFFLCYKRKWTFCAVSLCNSSHYILWVVCLRKIVSLYKTSELKQIEDGKKIMSETLDILVYTRWSVTFTHIFYFLLQKKECNIEKCKIIRGKCVKIAIPFTLYICTSCSFRFFLSWCNMFM